MRLFPKFLAVFLLVALAPLAFIGLRLVRETERSLRAAAMAGQEAAARREAEAVAERVEKVDVLLRLARWNPALLSIGPRRAQALRALLESEDDAAEVLLHDALGRPLARAARDPDQAASPDPDWNLLRAPLLEKSLVRGAADARGIFFHAAVPASPSGLAAVLTLRLRASALADALAAAGPSDGKISLSDEKGAPLAEAGASRPDDVEVRATVPSTGWTLSLRQPASLVFQPLRRARRRLAGALLAAATAAALACLFMARRLARPLSALGEAVRRMKDGDFRAPVPARTGDELGDLAADLQGAQASLEKRVRDAVLGRMSRMIGHDLRAPLQAVEEMLPALEKTDPRRAAIAREALAAARDFAEQIVAVGRDQPLSFQAADLNALVQSVLREGPEGVGPAPEVHLAEKLPAARLDPSVARRAVANIIKNAREAAASRVTVRTEAGNGSVSLIVSDDGPGLSPEKSARLFEEFSTKSGGAGLGLLVVKKVMDQHGGRVTLENAPAGGAVVRLDFPRHA